MLKTDTLKDAALYYGSKGLRVHPLKPGTKLPILNDWPDLASKDEAQINEWWTEHPTANVGIVTTSKLWVLDVDSRDWPEDAERQMSLSTASVTTPRGGRHYYFYHQTGHEITNSVSQIAPKVDTRGPRGYVVAPPSVVDGKSYAFIPMHTMDDIWPPAQAPSWLVEAFKNSNRKEITAHLSGNDIPAGQRNHALFSLAGNMRRMGMGVHEIRAALSMTNMERCKPPVEESEVGRIAESVCRYEADLMTVSFIEGAYEQLFGTTPEEATPIASKPAPAPKDLYDVPGIIGEFVAYCMATAPYPNKPLAFAAALSLMGHLCGRKVRDAKDNRTNFFILGLGASGSGKDYPRKVITRLIQRAGGTGLLGATASVEGLEDAFIVEPNLLLLTDEVDILISAFNDAKETRYSKIMGKYMEIFSSAASNYVTRSKANSAGTLVNNPCLTIYGTAVPDCYYAALNERMLSNGFFSRFLVIEGDKRGRMNNTPVVEMPLSLIDKVCWWLTAQPGDGNLAPNIRTIPYTRAALKACDEHAEFCDTQYDKAYASPYGNEAMLSVWSRMHETVRKLALIYACSADCENPVVTEQLFEMAVKLAKANAELSLYRINTNISSNAYHKDLQKIERLLQAEGGSVRKSKLLRNSNLSAKKLEDLLLTLSQRGSITLEQEGRAVIVKVRT